MPAVAALKLTMHSSPFASASLRAHYVRGAVGLVALAAAVAGAAFGAPAALGLLVLTAIAWRGCPTCWAIGLLQTRQRLVCSGPACRAPSGPR